MLPVIRLPRGIESHLEATARNLLTPSGARAIDFALPAGEAALADPDSLSWRIFKNPIALMVGGIAAVLLELAEPAVRTGIWRHSTFLRDPMGRLRRTGLAAMVTVYGARSIAEPMIRRVVGMHARVTGSTPAGEPYVANDPKLLNWVHATASFGFAEAYSRYVTALDAAELDAYYGEGAPAARLYGACGAPASRSGMDASFESMRDRLEGSAVVFEFLTVMRATRTLPAPLEWLQPLLVRAAVDTLPAWVRERLGLSAVHGLRRRERLIVRVAGALADRIMLPEGPPSRSCVRLGLPANYLYR
jgi:uncharacterized protein (DUF2236 family)